MNKERYNFIVEHSSMRFTFQSVGLKGSLKKVVEYTLIEINELMLYNLGFGDLNDVTGQLDDLSISNNGDRDKVLATVAAWFPFERYTNYEAFMVLRK